MRHFLKLFLAIWLAMPIAASADVFDDIRERGEVVIGVSVFPPWTYVDREGDLAGHEVDIGNRIAADLGVNARFVRYNFDEIFDALANDEIDMIAAGVAMTAERARRFHFSIPYFSTGITVAINPELIEDPDSQLNLNNPELTISVVEDTLADRIATARLGNARFMRFATAGSAEAAFLVGRAQAYVTSQPEASIFSLRHPGRVALPLEEPLVTSVAGFVVRDDEDRLLHFLNTWIHMRQADGFLADRYRQFFETLDWAGDLVEQ